MVDQGQVMITKKKVTIHLLRIFETHPWLTLSCLLITHGLTPAAAISMILRRMWLGRGRPLMNTPPSWLTLPWPWNGYPEKRVILGSTLSSLIPSL